MHAYVEPKGEANAEDGPPLLKLRRAGVVQGLGGEAAR